MPKHEKCAAILSEPWARTRGNGRIDLLAMTMRLPGMAEAIAGTIDGVPDRTLRNWSGRRDSNPRPQPWQGHGRRDTPLANLPEASEAALRNLVAAVEAVLLRASVSCSIRISGA